MATVQSETVTELRPIALPALPGQPLVSILVSNYNYARFIGESIKSALEQTYSNIELIICDDGSTDNTPQVLPYLLARYPFTRSVRVERRQTQTIDFAVGAP